jgi:CDP-glycerol glycerophosphotransferase
MLKIKFFLNFVKYFFGFFLNFLFLISFLIPKNKNIWIFSAWNGKKYSDNPKAIFSKILNGNRNIKAVWISKNKDLYLELKSAKLPSVYAYSIRGFYYHLIAGAAIFTHSVDWDFLSFLIGPKTKKIQTWHGIPIKKIGLDDKRFPNQFLRKKIIEFLLPYKKDFKYDLVLAASEYDQLIYESAFAVNKKKIVITGYPRNDQLFNVLKVRNSEVNKVIYMPTFRGDIGSEFSLLESSNFDFDKANKFMKSINAVLFIKLHPVQIYSKRDLLASKDKSNVILLNPSEDIYKNLASFNVLITDFSGIFFDFLITGKPVIMAPFDFANYLSFDRDIYVKYNEICPNRPCWNWNQVFSKLKEISINKKIDRRRYNFLQKKFHKYIDSNSSKRAFTEIYKLV